MKTKKVLALLVLAVMLISIMPMSVFALPGDFNTYSTVVEPPESSVSAQTYPVNGDDDGAEFTLTITEWIDGSLYVASSRSSVDYLYYKDANDVWQAYGGSLDKASFSDGSARTLELSMDTHAFQIVDGSSTYIAELKILSTAAGTSNIVFGKDSGDVLTYSRGSTPDPNGLVNIIQQRRYPAQFTSARAKSVLVSVNGYEFAPIVPDSVKGLNYAGNPQKPANNVDSYTLSAYVTTSTTAGDGLPVSGEIVTFSIIRGAGAGLSGSRATTNASGRAEIKVYSSRAGEVEVQARVSGADQGTKGNNYPDRVLLRFRSIGTVSLKAESTDNQKVARDLQALDPKGFTVSAYDANGNRLDLTEIIGPAGSPGNQRYFDDGKGKVASTWSDTIDLTAEIVSKPSNAALTASDIRYSVLSSGNFSIRVPYDKINRDGIYEVKVYLANGSSVSYRFDVKDQGEVSVMELRYGAKAYAAGTVLPVPDIAYIDADKYELVRAYTEAAIIGGTNLALSISDASYMDSQMIDGRFKLKDDKVGVVTMTAVDRDKGLVGSVALNIEKPASYLKLTPAASGAVGSEVQVNIELVDVDGKIAVTGLGANSSLSKAAVISRPEGAVAAVSNMYLSDFGRNGTANVRVSSNAAGAVGIQVIITENFGRLPGVEQVLGGSGLPNPPVEPGANYKVTDLYGGRTYTGACTVSFGTTTAGGGQLIFFIGAPSYVAGNVPFAAQSPAFIENDRTFLGVRDIGNAIGATIDWDPDTETATLAKDNVIVKITVGADNLIVTKNGVNSEIPTDMPAIIRNDRVYLPFRVLLEAFGYNVEWNAETQAIVCTI